MRSGPSSDKPTKTAKAAAIGSIETNKTLPIVKSPS